MVDFTENLRQLVERGDIDKATALECAPEPREAQDGCSRASRWRRRAFCERSAGCAECRHADMDDADAEAAAPRCWHGLSLLRRSLHSASAFCHSAFRRRGRSPAGRASTSARSSSSSSSPSTWPGSAPAGGSIATAARSACRRPLEPVMLGAGAARPGRWSGACRSSRFGFLAPARRSTSARP